MPLAVDFKTSLKIVETGNFGSGETAYSDSMDLAISLTTGTGAGQADLAIILDRSVATGANDDIDLNGVLTKALGGTFNAVELVGIIVSNAPKAGAANTTNLTIGGGTNPVVGMLGGTSPTLGPIRPGGVFTRFETDAAGICTITPATADILRIANSAGATNNYRIALICRTA